MAAPHCVVTGGAGFIGSHLVATLLSAGWSVAVLDVRKPRSDVRWLQLDVRNELGDAFRGADYVFHLAAVADARQCDKDPDECWSVNLGGTTNVLRAASAAGVKRIVLASTSWVASTQVGTDIDEDAPHGATQSASVYVASKLAQENACRTHRQAVGGPDWTILRYGTTIGERMWSGLVVRSFFEDATSRGVINIHGDGNQLRDYVDVLDLAAAHLRAVADVATNRTYYLTGAHPLSVLELAKEVTRHFPARIVFVPHRRVEPLLGRISNLRAQSELDWKPTADIAATISRCADWWRAVLRSGEVPSDPS
jgi:UDP-glucose 4-epimerase